MITETSKATDEAEIRGLIEGWAAAIRAKDADGVGLAAAGLFGLSPLARTSPRLPETFRIHGAVLARGTETGCGFKRRGSARLTEFRVWDAASQ